MLWANGNICASESAYWCLLMCRVAVGKMEEVTDGKMRRNKFQATNGYDSVVAWSKARQSNSPFDYNEICVYDNEAAFVEYILVVKIDNSNNNLVILFLLLHQMILSKRINWARTLMMKQSIMSKHLRLLLQICK